MDRWREYRYRQIVPMTHEQYLNEPAQTVTWTLALDNMAKEVAANG